ncbi:hypothetical protein [Brevibacterium jeotgali]|uniref:Lipoprotein LpqN n=1 Tax=Brevibacterium jeotgali TaxID=1262550 RepID=A0A2H1L5S3_9MICO|nr:hypothetical protein [Brevibacterium jeotgali]TWB98464.1 hypothetical protein FB108_2352 [Brevibacterium jeotgali]SMY12085.1 hypothetical protein BJEO58_01679 [Brevibacterium jeotgali]
MTRHQLPRWRRWGVAAASAALMLIVSGCGLVGVRLSDEAGGPLRVGAQPSMGPEPEPTETLDPALVDHTLQHVTFTDRCPARVSIHVPSRWTGNATDTSFNARPADSGLDGPRLSVFCSESFSESASESVSSLQSYQFSDSATTIGAERTGQAGPGYFWTYEAELGPEEAWSLDGPTSAVGSVVGYPIAGKVYQIQFNYYFATDDEAARGLATASIANLTVEGSAIGAPQWSSDAGDG